MRGCRYERRLFDSASVRLLRDFAFAKENVCKVERTCILL